MQLLKLIRWSNLLMIAFIQIVIKYALLQSFGVAMALDHLHFALLVLISIGLVAAGYIINDVYDVDADVVNKSKNVFINTSITEKTAYNLFFAFNILSIGLGFYLSNAIGKSSFFSFFVMISISLYVYASSLKRMPFVGNIIISALVGFSVLIVGIFDVVPMIYPGNASTQSTILDILLDYALFAFIITLLREMIKDIEDIDSDYKAGYNTLPIAIGRERAKKIAFAVSFLPMAAIIYYIVTYLYMHTVLIIYFLLFLLAPLLYVSIKLFLAKTQAHYAHISFVLKLIMLFGIISMILFKYILK